MMVPVTDAAPEAVGNRSDVYRDGLEEWYVNGPLGVEQGFVLRHAPACAGPKTITMAMDGNVVARLDDADDDGRAEIREVVAQEEAAPRPKLESLIEDVYAEPTAALREQLEELRPFCGAGHG